MKYFVAYEEFISLVAFECLVPVLAWRPDYPIENFVVFIYIFWQMLG
jgi:hypothetical protein